MTIQEAQTTVDNWIKTVGVRYFSELTNMAILSEKESDKGKDLGDELADVLWVLICLANQTGVDLTEAFAKNMDKKTIRDATRHLNNPKL